MHAAADVKMMCSSEVEIIGSTYGQNRMTCTSIFVFPDEFVLSIGAENELGTLTV